MATTMSTTAGIHPNLVLERSRVSFPLLPMSDYIYGPELRTRFLKLLNDLSSDPILQNHPSDHELGRTELHKKYLQKAIRFHEKFDIFEAKEYFVHFPEKLPTSLHTDMFVPTIKYFGTPEQHKKWLPLIYNYELVGAYAQTEMGHGSDVQSLETTATFDHNTDEFVLNSPTLSSVKWWPGNLGKNSNACVAFAQLIIDGKNYGVQMFMVPLRDPKTWKPYPSITVGDIGPKLGYNTVDNGFLKFENYRIPRENMLMGYAKVSRDGKFSKPANEKVAYAVMMYIRMLIVNGCWAHLAFSLTISIRYNLVRSQFKDDKGQEKMIMDYQTQMDKLITLIASTYTYNAGGRKIKDLYDENLERINGKGDFSLMADLHVALSGTKAIWSWQAAQGLEISRMSCGGHGYSYYSGHPQNYLNFVANCTLEGENTIMALQAARFLVKNLAQMRSGKEPAKTVAYLVHVSEVIQKKKANLPNNADEITLEAVEKLLQVNACYWIYVAGSKLQKGIKGGLSAKEAWDSVAGIDLVEATRAHVTAFGFMCFNEGLNKVGNEECQRVLSKLCLLNGIQQVLSYPVGLLESGYLSGEQLKLFRERKEKLLVEIRPDVIGLVEAFGVPDSSLNTAIGGYDGKPYERLWEWANQHNGWNKKEVLDGYLEALEKIQKERKKYPMPKL